MNESPLKQNRIVPLDKLKPHSRNYRSHPEGQIQRLVTSLDRFGQGRSIVVQDGPEGYLIVAGHGIVEAAKQLRYTELRADILPANWSVEDVEGYLIADNMHSQGAQDNEELLAQMLQEQQNAGYALESLGSDDESLRQLLESLGDEYAGNEGEDEEDDFEAEPDEEQTRVKLGDVWQLGRHRLLVGDCTDKKGIKRLMDNAYLDLIVTDPPYGVSYADKNRFLNALGKPNCIQEPIANDHGKIEDIAEKVWKPAYATMHEVAREGCVIYCCAPQGGDQMMMMMMMMMPLWPVRHELIWLKNNHVLGRADYSYKHEPILYAWKGTGHKYYGGFQTSILEFDRPQKSDLHPTMKPIALFAHLIRNNSLEGENVGDWFSGSGTTLIACERTNRNFFGCELEPKYADVILSRWEAETGQEATLLERVEEVVYA